MKKKLETSTLPTGGMHPLILSWYRYNTRVFRAEFSPAGQPYESSPPHRLKREYARCTRGEDNKNGKTWGEKKHTETKGQLVSVWRVPICA